MIKGFGYFSLFVFLLVGTQIGGFSPGFAIWFLSILLVTAGVCAFALLQFPRELENGILKKILHVGKLDLKFFVKEMSELATVVRRDGLLAAEGIRKDLKDPLLKYLIKRVMDGYDKAILIQIVQNQLVRQDELFSELQNYFDRVLQMIPVVGLLGALFQIMDYFARAGSTPAPSVSQLSSLFVPFVLALVTQLFIQAICQSKISSALDRGRLYFSLMAEGISGIQEGINADLLRDKIHYRLLEAPRPAVE